MSEDFDLIGEIVGDIWTAVIAFILNPIVAALNGALSFLGENVIDLND
jgi:hypothetical protein